MMPQRQNIQPNHKSYKNLPYITILPQNGMIERELPYIHQKKRVIPISALFYELTSKYENDRNVRITLVF